MVSYFSVSNIIQKAEMLHSFNDTKSKTYKLDRIDLKFLFFAAILMIPVAALNFIIDIRRQDLLFIAVDGLSAVLWITVMLRLKRGKKRQAALLIFGVFGNVYLIKAVYLIIAVDRLQAPLIFGLFFVFQIMNIIAIGYYSKKTVYLSCR